MVISRQEAIRRCPEYVKFVEGDYSSFDAVNALFKTLKRGSKAMTYVENTRHFIIGKISSVNANSLLAVDGPIVRFSDERFSWRVDGDKYAVPVT